MNGALKWKLIAGFFLVFLAGGMTGAFVGASHARHLFQFHHPGLIGARMKERLQRELNLTPEQVAKISPIIDKTAGQLREIRHDTGRRVHEVMTGAHREMAANLTDEQRQKLQQIEDRHRRWHRARGPHAFTPEPSASP
jgi:Spy/CpxP family protein refolding chaperone